MKIFLKNFVLFITIVAVSILLFSCVSSRRIMGLEEGWDLLGTAKVNFIKDKDEIPVRSRNMYTAIRFAVEDKDIHLSEVKIYLNNGDILQPALSDVIKAGEQSRVIDLAADGRMIDHI